MIEVADVFRRFAPDYLAAHGASMPPSHRRAITDILACRTEALGGHLWRCDHCSAERFAYHSCKNRSCPECHTDQTEQWLQARRAEMLPSRYFHVTVTVPEDLREVLRTNQRDGYAILMKAAAEAIIELARDPRHVGGSVGVLAVLHTWTQQLTFHPHVHCLVTGGGVSADGRLWHPARDDFLVPVKALAKLVRGKLRAGFAARRPDLVLPQAVWSKPWVVHCTAWGEGEQAVLDYLARYVFRVAITNARIVGLDDQTVTIRHKHRKSNRWRTTRMPGHEFMRRFLQHVLPKRLHKVRYFGLWHPARRDQAARARLLLQLERPAITHNAETVVADPDPNPDPVRPEEPAPVRAASKGTWSAFDASPPSRHTDHDPPRRAVREPSLCPAGPRQIRRRLRLVARRKKRRNGGSRGRIRAATHGESPSPSCSIQASAHRRRRKTWRGPPGARHSDLKFP